MISPTTRPQQSKADTVVSLRDKGFSLDKAYLVGYRGYYSRTFAPDGNNRQVYDDAMFLISPGHFSSYNFNTDPGAYRQGIATLLPGCWRYKVGIHGLSKPKDQQYKAFVQAAKVTVQRDQSITESGYFGINIHPGGNTTVSSLGCQTIYNPQWADFFSTTCSEMLRYGHDVIDYILIDLDQIQKH